MERNENLLPLLLSGKISRHHEQVHKGFMDSWHIVSLRYRIILSLSRLHFDSACHMHERLQRSSLPDYMLLVTVSFKSSASTVQALPTPGALRLTFCRDVPAFVDLRAVAFTGVSFSRPRRLGLLSSFLSDPPTRKTLLLRPL
jgi:hypothetical protein